MDLNLKDKVFLVTGGASGIGAGISRALVAEGALPVIVGRNKAKGDAILEELGMGFQIVKNLGTTESCREVVEEALQLTGRVDGLVNNAGANDGVGLENGSPEAWINSLQKNLHHYFYLAHYLLPELKQRKGSIINVSSKTAVTGQGNTSAYAAAKGAQLALTREWAVELLPYHIRVNALVPAEVMTPLYRTWLDTFDDPAAKQRSIESKIPLGQRMTTCEEMADMALFLLSDRASHITGQHFFIDGGYVHLDRAL
ncbi:MAG: SDR family oxidoreductase [Phaeodactylibacter xiamenensis]|uniref:Short-chain dehydrogenase n=1 Tax=Phaeodactylibacter xiamenensis TaxID=1524460 RepID=A0A098S0A0_9BACT|nr:SDR family oxidoreductase [Phaeodactylibacter xiamenensis]KGE85238.1 short-chain dehydrogenase [Phaeodactylibacter xiamenensis]MCR9054011.1 SDR family oxidoreductase [bacterium]